MGVERFLRKTDGLESTEPLGPGGTPKDTDSGAGGIPPVEPDRSSGFGIGSFSTNLTVSPAASTPDFPGLKALISALNRREAALRDDDIEAVAQATAQAQAAIDQIREELDPRRAPDSGERAARL